MLGKTDVFMGVNLEELEYSVRPRSVQLCDGVLVLLQRDGTKDEVPVSLHLPLPQHCGQIISSGQQPKHPEHSKRAKSTEGRKITHGRR
jgi:hypothetical protein